MNVQFLGAEALMDGIRELSGLLSFSVTEEETADVTVQVTAVDTELCSLVLTGKQASIVYGGKNSVFGGKSRFFRALSYLSDALKNGKTEFSVEEHPCFSSNGAMTDMSRNAVMRPAVVMDMLRRMALMGLNTYMLYTEDTYEIPERPYFGHLRGRYTKEEIREMDAAARSLGIELIPCVQFLGHLATFLRWNAGAYKDTERVLLVGEEETYRLIDDMLRAIADSFSSRRLHMGMDETHDLGRGAYLDRNGFTPRKELYFAHLKRVSQMAKSYGFRPMMWSDMFFRVSAEGMAGYGDYDLRTVLPDDIGQMLPAGVQPVFWDYYHANKEFYSVNLEKHRKLSAETLFAGGVWAWSGYAVQVERSRKMSLPALEACKEAGTKEVICTIWHNGSESLPYAGLGGLALYAEYDYRGTGELDAVSACFARCCFADYAVLTTASEADYEHGYGSARALLYNDPLLGMLDAHLKNLPLAAYYRSLSEKLDALPAPGDDFAAVLRLTRALTAVLEHKADFGVRLKAAYDAKDREQLRLLLAECGLIAERIGTLRSVHREVWMQFSKPFGWEVFDIRYGGLLSRFETAKAALSAYLAGETEHIEELEAPRLRIDCRPADTEGTLGDLMTWRGYLSAATPNIL